MKKNSKQLDHLPPSVRREIVEKEIDKAAKGHRTTIIKLMDSYSINRAAAESLFERIKAYLGEEDMPSELKPDI